MADGQRKKRQRVPAEQRAAIIAAINSGEPVAEVCKKHGVHVTTYRGWTKKQKPAKKTERKSHSMATSATRADKVVAVLRAENERLKNLLLDRLLNELKTA